MYRRSTSSQADSFTRTPTAGHGSVGKRTLTSALPGGGGSASTATTATKPGATTLVQASAAQVTPTSQVSATVAGGDTDGGGPATYTVKPGDTFPIVAALLTGNPGRAGELQSENPDVAALAPGVTLVIPRGWGGIVAGGGSLGIVEAARSWLSQMISMGSAPTPAAETTAASTSSASPAPAPAAPASTHADPLALAISKVGEVGYKNEKFLSGSGTLSDAENKALTSGSPDINVADCSSFMMWTLAAAGYLDDPKTRSQIIAAININKPLEHGSLSADITAGSDAIKGPAAGFKDAGIGDEVDKTAAKPGDYVQSWRSTSGGGHAFMVHRAHASGAAIVGGDTGPRLESGTTPTAPTAIGFDGAPARFVIDENTDPASVGAHTVEAIEELGCHLPGTNSDGEKVGGGVFTKGPVAWETFAKAYVGRLTASRWTGAAVAQAPAANITPDANERANPVLPTTPSPSARSGLISAIEDKLSGVAEAVTGGIASIAGGMRELLSLGEPVFSSEAASEPASTPATEVTQAAACEPFSAPGVRGCDYLVYPDRKIVYLVDGAPARAFPSEHALHAALHREIVTVYPELPY